MLVFMNRHVLGILSRRTPITLGRTQNVGLSLTFKLSLAKSFTDLNTANVCMPSDFCRYMYDV